MCERTYVGCPHCGERADGEVRSRELCTELVLRALDDEGDVDYNCDPDYDGNTDCADDGYQCIACGWSGNDLSDECVDESCDCRECVEPDPEDEGDEPEELVLLVRNPRAGPRKLAGDWPVECNLLYSSRANWCVAVPRWRAAELAHTCSHVGIEVEFPDFIPSGAIELAPEYDHDDRKVLTA